MTAEAQDVKGIRFTQVYDNSNRDSLEQCYAFSSGHKELAHRVRPHLMEQNIQDCLMLVSPAAVCALLQPLSVSSLGF